MLIMKDEEDANLQPGDELRLALLELRLRGRRQQREHGKLLGERLDEQLHLRSDGQLTGMASVERAERLSDRPAEL